MTTRVKGAAAGFALLLLAGGASAGPPENGICTAPPAHACRVETFHLQNNPALGTYTLWNCANATAAAVNNILSNTDAAATGLLRSGDVYAANNQWSSSSRSISTTGGSA